MSYAFYMKLGWTDEKLLKGCASVVATERKHALGRLHHGKVNILLNAVDQFHRSQLL